MQLAAGSASSDFLVQEILSSNIDGVTGVITFTITTIYPEHYAQYKPNLYKIFFPEAGNDYPTPSNLLENELYFLKDLNGTEIALYLTEADAVNDDDRITFTNEVLTGLTDKFYFYYTSTLRPLEQAGINRLHHIPLSEPRTFKTYAKAFIDGFELIRDPSNISTNLGFNNNDNVNPEIRNLTITFNPLTIHLFKTTNIPGIPIVTVDTEYTETNIVEIVDDSIVLYGTNGTDPAETITVDFEEFDYLDANTHELPSQIQVTIVDAIFETEEGNISLGDISQTLNLASNKNDYVSGSLSLYGITGKIYLQSNFFPTVSSGLKFIRHDYDAGFGTPTGITNGHFYLYPDNKFYYKFDIFTNHILYYSRHRNILEATGPIGPEDAALDFFNSTDYYISGTGFIGLNVNPTITFSDGIIYI